MARGVTSVPAAVREGVGSPAYADGPTRTSQILFACPSFSVCQFSSLGLGNSVAFGFV